MKYSRRVYSIWYITEKAIKCEMTAREAKREQATDEELAVLRKYIWIGG